jgi:holo-[acyl-carrier protein] synthase
MILGLGLDACDCGRMRLILERRGQSFLTRVCTPAEIAYVQARPRPWEHAAARFAAKEAVFKALGAPPGIGWKDVEVLRATGVPVVLLHGAAAAEARTLGVEQIHLALTHERGLAIAVVALEG